MSNDLEDLRRLIQQSADEDPDFLDTVEEQPSTRALLNHPQQVLMAWVFSLTIALIFVLGPALWRQDVGVRSVDVRLNAALYHVAYRVEVYRNINGQLPDYLEDHWSRSGQIEYHVGPQGYQLTGRLGDHELIYREGENPESLIQHFASRTSNE